MFFFFSLSLFSLFFYKYNVSYIFFKEGKKKSTLFVSIGVLGKK